MYQITARTESRHTRVDLACVIPNKPISKPYINCDILHSDPKLDGKDLLDLCDIFDLDCLIKEPTRITSTSESLIDVILTNNKRRFLSSATVEPHVSDHQLVYTVMKAKASFKRSRKITCRSYKSYDKEAFVADLAMVPFHVVSIFDDPDDQAWAFQKLLTGVIDEHAPIKTFHIRGGHVPYMTPAWRKAIRHRNRLWNKHKKLQTTENWIPIRNKEMPVHPSEGTLSPTTIAIKHQTSHPSGRSSGKLLCHSFTPNAARQMTLCIRRLICIRRFMPGYP